MFLSGCQPISQKKNTCLPASVRNDVILFLYVALDSDKRFYLRQEERAGKSQKSKPFMEVCGRSGHPETCLFYLYADPSGSFYRYSGANDLIVFSDYASDDFLFFVLTLIISHLSLETDFPKADDQGYLPYDYYEHQLAVSLDYHPTSRLANWIFGGFNSHAAHHLFPGLPHTVYTIITPAIKKQPSGTIFLIMKKVLRAQ
jgi:hypothetical protein